LCRPFTFVSSRSSDASTFINMHEMRTS
jgi:hypothetical protein